MKSLVEEAPSWLPALLTNDTLRIQRDIILRARRSAFVRLASPVIIQDLLSVVVINIVKDLFLKLDTSVVYILLSQVIKMKTANKSSTEAAIVALEQLSEPEDYIKKQPL